MMTLNFTTLLKTPHQPPGPDRTLDLFDLPESALAEDDQAHEDEEDSDDS